MDDINEIPEHVREKIKEVVDLTPAPIPIPDEIKHLLTQLLFEMYKAGWDDACRATEQSAKKLGETFKG